MDVRKSILRGEILTWVVQSTTLVKFKFQHRQLSQSCKKKKGKFQFLTPIIFLTVTLKGFRIVRVQTLMKYCQEIQESVNKVQPYYALKILKKHFEKA